MNAAHSREKSFLIMKSQVVHETVSRYARGQGRISCQEDAVIQKIRKHCNDQPLKAV